MENIKKVACFLIVIGVVVTISATEAENPTETTLVVRIFFV